MKKTLLLFTVLCAAYNLSAQSCDETLPISIDFSDPNIIPVCWNVIDADVDGHNWSISDLGGGNNGLQSASYLQSEGRPLTPDNWVITNAIDLTAYNSSSSITLTWRVITPDWSFDKENYAVYAANGNQISDFISSPVVFQENLDNSDASGVWANRSFNISSLAGQMVYIAFRHYNVTDQNVIDIDDVSLTSSTLGIEDFNKENFRYYYSSDSETLTLKSINKTLSSISIYNILGQGVIYKKLYDSVENINLSSLVKGVYIAQIEIDNTIKAIKFLKS